MTRSEKTETARAAIVAAMKEDPVRTMAELAKIAGCSKQRVHQILINEGIKAATQSQVRRARGIVISPTSRFNIDGPKINISHSSAGTVSEMLAAADLITRGWFVFFPLVRTAKCDLIALSSSGKRVTRIEVRSGRRVGGSLQYNKKPNDPCDHYAIVLENEPILFIPDIGSGID